MAIFPGLPRSAGARRNLLLDFMVQGKMTKSATLTIQMGATPSGLISDPPPSSAPTFTLDALPAATLPLYPGLGQAPNTLACIPSGVKLNTLSEQCDQSRPVGLAGGRSFRTADKGENLTAGTGV